MKIEFGHPDTFFKRVFMIGVGAAPLKLNLQNVILTGRGEAELIRMLPRATGNYVAKSAFWIVCLPNVAVNVDQGGVTWIQKDPYGY